MTKYRAFLLERAHSVEILLIMHGRDKLPLMELHDMIAVNRGAVRNRVDELARAGMIKIEIVKDPKRRRILSLTPIGAEISSHLAEIERLMKR